MKEPRSKNEKTENEDVNLINLEPDEDERI